MRLRTEDASTEEPFVSIDYHILSGRLIQQQLLVCLTHIQFGELFSTGQFRE